MSNVDSRTKAFFDRMVRLETEKREIAESVRDLAKEMKGVGLLAEEIAGIKLAVKRHFETEDKKATRESAEAVADALGDFKDTGLGAAAVERATHSPATIKAAKKFVDRVKSSGAELTIETPGFPPIHIGADGVRTQ